MKTFWAQCYYISDRCEYEQQYMFYKIKTKQNKTESLYSILNLLPFTFEWVCKLISADNFWFISSKNGLLLCVFLKHRGRPTERPWSLQHLKDQLTDLIIYVQWRKEIHSWVNESGTRGSSVLQISKHLHPSRVLSHSPEWSSLWLVPSEMPHRDPCFL